MDLEVLLRALADRTRLRLLSLLRDREVCVCFLVEALKTSQPKISRHLAYLRNSGLVSARREGLWMHYRVIPPQDAAVRKVLTQVMSALESDPQMQKDFERMEKACCAPEKFVRLESPPVPRRV
jgi:ArsR family transcriptional regulator, arsenate/arsenite/antimonite-responsive transcriptional repressor